MALGSVLAHTIEEKERVKKSKQTKQTKKIQEQTPSAQEIKVAFLDRCQHSTCVTCRKHASCILKPRENGSCPSLEVGPAWDHKCKSKLLRIIEEDDYFDED